MQSDERLWLEDRGAIPSRQLSRILKQDVLTAVDLLLDEQEPRQLRDTILSAASLSEVRAATVQRYLEEETSSQGRYAITDAGDKTKMIERKAWQAG